MYKEDLVKMNKSKEHRDKVAESLTKDPNRLVKCQRCGIEKPLSEYYSLHRKYCAKCECEMQKEKRKIERVKWQKPRKCVICGKEFLPKQDNSKYCSQKCRGQWYKLLEPTERKAFTLSSCLRGKGKGEKVLKLLKGAVDKPCKYCGTIITLENASLDHKTPTKWRSRKNNPEKTLIDDKISNLQIVCKKCNGLKGDFNDEQFRRLLKFLEENPDLAGTLKKRLSSSFAIFNFKSARR